MLGSQFVYHFAKTFYSPAYIYSLVLDKFSTSYEWPVRVRCGCSEEHPPAPSTPRRTERLIYFVYGYGLRTAGSTFLRLDQMNSIIRTFFPNVVTRLVTDRFLRQASPQDSIIVFSKSSLKHLDSAEISRLQARNNLVLIDLVDGTYCDWMSISNGFLCASLSELEFHTEKGNAACLVPHSYDMRIQTANQVQNEFRVGYVGGKWTKTLPWAEMKVDAVIVSPNVRPFDRNPIWSRNAMQLSHHLLVRQNQLGPESLIFKPPTKLATAIRMNAIPIVSNADTELRKWLSDDYPYKFDDWSDLGDVLARANSDFMGGVSLEHVIDTKNLRRQFCPILSTYAFLDYVENISPLDSK
jgi:hypothetical protein